MDNEVPVGTIDPLDVFILSDIEPVVFGNLTVVFEGLVAVGFLIRAGEGHIADLEQLRRGEERHVGGVVEERVAEASLVHQKGRKTSSLRLDCTGKTCCSCTNYE